MRSEEELAISSRFEPLDLQFRRGCSSLQELRLSFHCPLLSRCPLSGLPALRSLDLHFAPCELQSFEGGTSRPCRLVTCFWRSLWPQYGALEVNFDRFRAGFQGLVLLESLQLEMKGCQRLLRLRVVSEDMRRLRRLRLRLMVARNGREARIDVQPRMVKA